jgi:uncharacterized protein (DUF924 family)
MHGPETPAPDVILDFWFGDRSLSDARIARRQSDLWWGASADADRDIARRFALAHERATAGELDAWTGNAQGRLALIVLLDQFSRNMFRGTPRAFACDAQARSLCVDGVAQGVDRGLRPIERVFFYLPLEHAESREDQARSVSLFEALAADASAETRELFADYAEYARRHRDIVDRFGRFPHRNAILKRESSAAEQAFLLQPGSSF